nr:MAG TPA: hypothetical protein [Caudoviricetes sp.]DAS33968.1 MAG TPA: hypothetical protein [Caudoviricetes sp.]
MQNTAGSSCLGHSCTKIVQLFLIIQKQKSPTLSNFGESEREAIRIVKGIKRPSLLYPFYQEMR